MNKYLVLIFFVWNTLAFAAIDSIEKIDKTLENFGSKILSSKIKKAVDILISSRFGKSLGFEKFKSCKVGDSIYRTQYIQKFEKSYLVWDFRFYNPGSGWILNKYLWGEQIPLISDATCQ